MQQEVGILVACEHAVVMHKHNKDAALATVQLLLRDAIAL